MAVRKNDADWNWYDGTRLQRCASLTRSHDRSNACTKTLPIPVPILLGCAHVELYRVRCARGMRSDGTLLRAPDRCRRSMRGRLRPEPEALPPNPGEFRRLRTRSCQVHCGLQTIGTRDYGELNPSWPYHSNISPNRGNPDETHRCLRRRCDSRTANPSWSTPSRVSH